MSPDEPSQRENGPNESREKRALALSSVTRALPVSRGARRQLTEILSQSIFPLLGEYVSCERVEAGDYLWKEGESAQSVALILVGRVETLKETEFPARPFVTGIFSAGTVVGEDGFLSDLPRSSTARVLESCELLVLSRKSFECLERAHPAVANLILKWILDLLSDRLHNAQKRLATIF